MLSQKGFFQQERMATNVARITVVSSLLIAAAALASIPVSFLLTVFLLNLAMTMLLPSSLWLITNCPENSEPRSPCSLPR